MPKSLPAGCPRAPTEGGGTTGEWIDNRCGDRAAGPRPEGVANAGAMPADLHGIVRSPVSRVGGRRRRTGCGRNLIVPKLLLVLAAVLAALCSPARGDPGFRKWIAEFCAAAVAQGITRETCDAAFAGIEAPDARVLRKARYQPEFTLEIWDYLDPRVNRRTVERGEQMAERYATVLEAVERRFGVRPAVVLAIWSMETGYGAVLDRPERLHRVPHALATLAYGDPKRAKFARTQLMSVLRILQDGDVTPEELLGSWAGAMGHTQFIPTSYLAYAVDMDDDGRRDIWNSVPDALGTAASLLAQNGWSRARTWGYEVEAPAGAERYAGETRTLAQWRDLGFRRPAERPYPHPGDRAELKLPAGAEGPAFLMLRNFFVLRRYNPSDKYALAVGLLADRLIGGSGLVHSWPRPPGSLAMEEKFELQERLKAAGLYDGAVDGYLGSGSRQGIRAFQERSGLPVNGEPSLELLQALRTVGS